MNIEHYISHSWKSLSRLMLGPWNVVGAMPGHYLKDLGRKSFYISVSHLLTCVLGSDFSNWKDKPPGLQCELLCQWFLLISHNSKHFIFNSKVVTFLYTAWNKQKSSYKNSKLECLIETSMSLRHNLLLAVIASWIFLH